MYTDRFYMQCLEPAERKRLLTLDVMECLGTCSKSYSWEWLLQVSLDGRVGPWIRLALWHVHFSFSVSQCLIRLPQVPGEVGHTVVIGPQSAQAKGLLFADPPPASVGDPRPSPVRRGCRR